MNWIVLSLLSLLFIGLGNFCFRMSTLAGQNVLIATALSYLAQIVFGVVIVVVLKPPLNISTSAIAWPVAAGLLVGAGGLCMMQALAKPGVQAGVPVSIMNANFVLVGIMAWIFLHQPLSGKQILGFLIILGGLVLVI